MRKSTYICIIIFLSLVRDLNAQVVFVDAVKGNDEANGTITDPLASLEKAVALASDFTGKGQVTIKIYPGLCVLEDQLEIKTRKHVDDTLKYSLEAAIMPDDPDWQPGKMPVIQSISPDNSQTQFPHAVGFLVSRNNVSFKGLKFLGNTNPNVLYYYPITRENDSYKGLEVSQCYFIGEKNSAPIQGGIWAHGAGTKIDHCIFYGCKNALLLFQSIKGFSVTNSIIYGAYEAAVWFGPYDSDFTFQNNIVSHCNYFWLRPEDTFPEYTFSNSMITDNKHYMGMYTRTGLVEAKKNNHTETGIRKSGKIILTEVETNGLPKDYLNLSPQLDGQDINAGIFKNTMK